MSYETEMTIEYYNQHADEYVENTLSADMSFARNKFLSYIPEGGTILDFGCGSGRDSKAFLDTGYKVVALDGSKVLCKRAEQLIGQPVCCCRFQEYKADAQFDGIWACASLLHLQKEELRVVVEQLAKSLKPNSVLYMSFKYGDYSGKRNGRWYTDLNEETASCFQVLSVQETWISQDARNNHQAEQWINIICTRKQ